MLYRLDPDATVSEWCNDIGIANTLAWSPDQRRFYFGDTAENIVRVYGYDPTAGSISNRQPFLEGFRKGLPDGSCVDAEGSLWNCRYSGGCIVRVAPSGEIDRVIDMPVNNITTCTFGGSDGRTLYVTTARAEATRSERFAGGLFALRTEIRGQPENRFAAFGGSRRR